MATITYTFVDRCSSGGHTQFDVAIGAAPAQRIAVDTDWMREPLSNLSQQEQDQLKMLILKVHMAGKTRAQIVTELAAPVVVTI